MEDWKISAIDKLKQYEDKRQSLEIIPMQIAEIESTMTSIRSGRTDAAPVRNSKGNAREDMLLNCISKMDELRSNLDRARLWKSIVDRGLLVLNQEERKLLSRVYIIGERGAIVKLAEEWFIEERAVYKRRDAALRKFTIALYGCVES